MHSVLANQIADILTPSDKRNYQFLPYDAKMQILLSTMEQGTVKYIANSMELRQFLVSKPKRPF